MSKEEKKEQKEQEIKEMEAFKEDDIKTTKISNLKDIIKLKLEQLKDIASLELALPIHIRLMKRLEAIRKMSSAENLKINKHWKTIPPKIYITNLEGKKVNQNEARISFGVYVTDEKGNKKLFKNEVEDVLADGRKVKRTLSAEYKVGYEVIETISYRKPITRETIKVTEV